MTRWRGSSLAVALAAMVWASPATAMESELSLILGVESLSEDRLDDAGVRGGTLYGLRTNHDFGWPVLIAVDLLFSGDDATKSFPGAFPLSVETDVDTRELQVGVRRYFRDPEVTLRPYAGGGLSLAQMDVKQVESGSFGPGTEYSNVVVDDEDSAVGYWLGGGLGWFRGKLVLGGDVRWSNASSEVSPVGGGGDVDVDTGGYVYGAFVGYRW